MHRIITAFINYLNLHLFLALVSLPLIVAWGLPSSWLSPLGNFIFNPFISLFLFLSSFAFFSELVGLPHVWCNWLLEQLTNCWHWFLQLAPSAVLYGFPHISWWLLAAIACSTFAAVMHPFMRHPTHRLLGLTAIFCISMALIRAHEPSSFFYTMPCHQGSIALIRANNNTIVIDPGYIGSRQSARSWISYTFMPELIAKTGSLTIDHLFILKPTIVTCEALTTLLDTAYIHHIYMPLLQGELTGSFKRAFGTLYARIKQRNISFTRVDTSYSFPAIPSLVITTHGVKKYQTITYPHIVMEGSIENTPIAIRGR